MSKKGILIRVVIIVVAILLNVGIVFYKISPRMQDITVQISYESKAANTIELFYLTSQDDYEKGYTPAKSYAKDYDEEKINTTYMFEFKVPGDIEHLRFDFGTGEETYENRIQAVNILFQGNTLAIAPEKLFITEEEKDICSTLVTDKGLIVNAQGEDPHIAWNVEDWGICELIQGANANRNLIIKIVLCGLIDILALVCVIKFQKLMDLPKEIWENKKLILNLSKNDFKTKYAGSYLGIVWGFIQPIVTVLVYWFVFEKGLKAGASLTKAGVSVPFVLWLVAGMVPWLFFQDALIGGMNSLIEYSYLVKKVVFKIDILPIVKVLAALYVHVFFVVFTLVLYSGYHYYPDIYDLQILYYSGAVFIFALAVSYFVAAITVFLRDTTQIINIILQVGVWITPIMWNIDTMELSPALITLLKLNPMYYIVLGYRQSLIDKRWFWENPSLTIYFWVLTIILFAVGSKVFRKLKVHFADVL